MATPPGRLRPILIISTAFFPDPMVASQRMTQWARFLPKYGWKPIVACRHYGYEAARDVLDQKVSPEVVVNYLNAAPDPNKMDTQERSAKFLQMLQTKLAEMLITPDAASRFWRAAVPSIRKLIQQYQPELILTTAPPYGVHCVGLELANELKVPWVADFREAFIADRRYRPFKINQKRWNALRKYEEDVYRDAALVIHQLPVHERWARRKYKHAANKCVTMINGFSDELISGTIPPSPSPWGRQSIRVIGTCLDSDAMSLVQSVNRLIRSGYDLEVRFVGRWPDNFPEMQKILGDRVVATGYLRYDRAAAEILGADVLVNYLSAERQSGLIISTKLIEYIATKKPIVEINPTLSDRQFSRPWPQVIMPENASYGAVADALMRALKAHDHIDEDAHAAYCRAFNWSNQVAKVAEWFHATADRKPIRR